MSMSFWVIVSWVFVFILTAINVGVFLKLKQASEQMMQMAFPGKSMKEVMSSMQGMMGGMQGGMKGMPGMQQGRGSRAGNSFGNMPRPAAGGGKQNMDAQLKAAMDMLNKMQKR
jgi:hypothetical protein